MPIPLFLTIFIFCVIWLNIKIKKSSKTYRKIIDDFHKKEAASNSSRKKDIDENLFIFIDKTILENIIISNIPENERILKKQSDLILLSQKKLLYFETYMSNTDIKLNYGVANLENVSYYEENYNRFMLNCLDFSKSLKKLNYIDESIIVLKFVISYKCDILQFFILLIDYYIEINDTSNLSKLESDILNNIIFCSENIKTKVLDYITSSLN